MADKKFLEEYPLYKKFVTDREFYLSYDHTYLRNNKVPKPAIHMYCKVCGSEQTFNMINEYYKNSADANEAIHGEIKELRYVCSDCNEGLIVFLIHFGVEKKNKDKSLIYLEKVGQIPAWSIKMDKELEKLLGEHADYYKKGLINESQGYGIGAHAYFRRITEDIIDELLDSIYELIEQEEKEKYKQALDKTKTTRIAQEKIDLVKDLLPNSLKPDGVNPLGVIHSALSKGLHELSDEECMAQAELIRDSLVFLINQIVRSKSSSKSFTESMRKLLGKKTETKKE